jgi:hypothetical protein
MTSQVVTVPDPEGDLRWREWQARGAAGERRTARRMRTIMLLTAAFLAIWLTVLLA